MLGLKPSRARIQLNAARAATHQEYSVIANSAHHFTKKELEQKWMYKR